MKVVFTEYALMRMQMRDILLEEVITALESSPSKHRKRKDGRSEVINRVGQRILLVVYRDTIDERRVINAMWENRV